jgi:hypothetical protein
MVRKREEKFADEILTGAGLSSDEARTHRDFFLFGFIKARYGLSAGFAFLMLLLWANANS